jgi:hypothetical protein
MTRWDPFECPLFASRERSVTVSLTFYFNDLCPRCRKPIMQAVIESHPDNRDRALQKFHCADCGPVKTTVISLKPYKSPGKSRSGLAA